MQLLFLQWILLYLSLGAVGLPLTARLFPRLPRRGAAFAFPVALVVLTVPAYWVGQVAFGLPALSAGVVALIGAAALSWRRTESLPWGGYAEAAVVFVAAFSLLAAVRAVDPAIHYAGGEKFLDFALVNAVLRADSLPPEDPWFAGRAVRYYYGGHLVTALLVRLTGTEPNVAYNLAVPGFYATMVTAAYGLAGAIAAESGRSRRLAGLAGAFFAGLAGTLATPGRILLGLLPESLARAYGQALLVGIKLPPDEALAFARGIVEGSYTHWWARYVIPKVPDVFPFWAFVNGDLRPHMTDGGFLLLAAALAYSYHATPEAERRRRRVLLFGAFPVTAGLVGIVNTWSLPAAVGLAGLTVALADADPATLYPRQVRTAVASPTGERLRPLVAAGPAALVGLLSVAWCAPLVLLRTAENEGLMFFPPRTGFVGFLLVFGAFVGLFALFLLPRAVSLVRSGDRTARRFAVVAVACLTGFLVGFPVLAVAGPLVVVGALARQRGAVGYAAVLVVAGAGLALVPELLVAKVWPYNPDAPRWNTVYKIHAHVWLFWGVAAGPAFAAVVGDAVVGVRDWARGNGNATARGVASVAAVALVVLLAVGAAAFPIAALGAHFDEAVKDDVDPTFDGTRYVDQTHPQEAEAIAWLASRPGTPTIVSAPSNNTYRWRNAPSALTGVPTVVGWRHEVGYHGREPYERRLVDARDIYTGNASTTRRLLDRYDVTYVYVGPLERAAYGERDFAALRGIDVAFENEGVTIYRVDRSVAFAGAESRPTE